MDQRWQKCILVFSVLSSHCRLNLYLCQNGFSKDIIRIKTTFAQAELINDSHTQNYIHSNLISIYGILFAGSSFDFDCCLMFDVIECCGLVGVTYTNQNSFYILQYNPCTIESHYEDSAVNIIRCVFLFSCILGASVGSQSNSKISREEKKRPKTSF